MSEPRLRSVDKVPPPYKLNDFPKGFVYSLARELVYHVATRSSRLEGADWEAMFAECIGAEWKPSNVGLDDVVLSQCAWGAKTVKAPRPSEARQVRLISGRNSPNYSFDQSDPKGINPHELGGMVLSIWNERVSAIRAKYKHLRTVVLVKSADLLEVAVFEFETIRFENDQHSWSWNKNGNLEGKSNTTGGHKFTWQPHGAQFTIVEDVPSSRLAIQIKPPRALDKKQLLVDMGFSKKWFKVL